MTPKIGMSYKEAATRCTRIMRNPGHPEAKANLINSIKNQCRLAEGEKSLNDLNAELSAKHTSSPTFSGAGTKQTGYGPGHKLGDGRWRYANGKWEKI